MRRLIAALGLVALSFLPACSPEVYEILGGYYVRDGKVYWSGGIDSSDHQRVVVGADPGSKYDKAASLGISILDEAGLQALLK